MKRVGFAKLMMMSALFGVVIASNSIKAQAFGGKGSKQFLIGVGMAEYNTWYPEDGSGLKGRFSPLSGILNFQGEFGVGQYVGIGFSIGVNYSSRVRDKNNWVGYNNPFYNGGKDEFWSIGIPVSILSNFHFLQLINDKSGKNFAEKLDVYVGLSLGAGPSFLVPRKNFKNLGGDVGVMIFGGPHVGIRFFPKEKFGIYLEAGYGKSFLNGGICFKL